MAAVRTADTQRVQTYWMYGGLVSTLVRNVREDGPNVEATHSTNMTCLVLVLKNEWCSVDRK